jgi:hypothetical protein
MNLYLSCLGERPHVGLLGNLFSAPIKRLVRSFLSVCCCGWPLAGPFDSAGYFVGTHGERNRLIAEGCPPEKVRVVLSAIGSREKVRGFIFDFFGGIHGTEALDYLHRALFAAQGGEGIY